MHCCAVPVDSVQFMPVQYSPVQRNALIYSAVQCSSVQYSAAQCSIVNYTEVKCSKVRLSAEVYFSAGQYIQVEPSVVLCVLCSFKQCSAVASSLAKHSRCFPPNYQYSMALAHGLQTSIHLHFCKKIQTNAGGKDPRTNQFP